MFGYSPVMRPLKWLTFVAVISVVAPAVGCTPASGLPKGAPGRDRPARVVLYGDSLAYQAAPFFRALITAHGKADLQIKATPGTAICDLLADMSRTVRRFRPDDVVVEFSGNSLTPCMRDRATGQGIVGDALVARYRSDAEKAIGALTRYDALMYLIGPPADRSSSLSQTAADIKAVYQALPSSFDHVRFVDAGQSVLDHGHYTDALPCLPNEPCTGPVIHGVRANRVRAPDGVHFCPVAVSGRAPCPVWSSGAFRFGAAMAAPIIADFGL